MVGEAIPDLDQDIVNLTTAGAVETAVAAFGEGAAEGDTQTEAGAMIEATLLEGVQATKATIINRTAGAGAEGAIIGDVSAARGVAGGACCASCMQCTHACF